MADISGNTGTGDLMGRLQQVLNDPESMRQIGELAQLLGQSDGESSGPSGGLGDLSGLLGNGGGPALPENNGTSGVPGASGDISGLPDLGALMKLGQVLQGTMKNDKNLDLLLALRPLLRPETQGKLDRIIRIYRLMAVYPALKQSGLTRDLLGLLG